MIFIRKNNFFVFVVCVFSLSVFKSCTELGCTDSSAENYNSNATEDDGSCVVLGCMDASAENYNSNATEDNESCIYSCVDPEVHCLEINFNHYIDNMEVVYGNDNMFYENAAGTSYSVRRVLYVLSDIILFFEDGTNLLLDEFFFINSDDSNTLNRLIYNLPDVCVGISFRLGFSSQNNVDNNYINSSNNFHLSMLWPNLNGTNLAFQGGYHYMKLEGKYTDENSDVFFYNTHTGPINGDDFSILYNQFLFEPTSSISINMNINNWYNEPIYNMANFGNGIMDNLDAQNILFENGLDVFTIQAN